MRDSTLPRFASLGQKNCSSEDQRDDSFNRKAALMKGLSVVLWCSPVCEKQALFAILQSYKENGIEEQLIRKVLSQAAPLVGRRVCSSDAVCVCCRHWPVCAESWATAA